MENLNIEIIQKNLFEIQDILFNNKSLNDALNHLKESNISLENIFKVFILDENEGKINLIISLINVLLKFKGFNELLINLILQEIHDNINNNLFKIKSIEAKKYFLNIIKTEIKIFIKENNFLIKLFKLYFLDKNTGIYEQSIKFFIFLLKDENYSNEIKNENFINNIIDYLSSMILSNDSIYLIRKFEIILIFLNYDSNNIKINNELDKMCNDFINYDLLTQLSFLETMEDDILIENTVILTNPMKNFFNGIYIENLDNQCLRKLLYTFSKLYASNLLNFEIKLIKNIICISVQYYNDNISTGMDFISKIILNIFHNKNIFDFLLNNENNIQFDFLENILNIINEIYSDPQPLGKINGLEIFGKIFEFKKKNINSNDINAFNDVNENNQIEFIKLLLKKITKISNNNELALNKFNELLYSDFKKRDLPDYELAYLNCIYSMLSSDLMLKSLLSNFDFVLYLLERREKPKEVCVAKYLINEEIIKHNEIMEKMNKEFSNQFINYVNKGPFKK